MLQLLVPAPLGGQGGRQADPLRLQRAAGGVQELREHGAGRGLPPDPARDEEPQIQIAAAALVFLAT